jgi:hypothetical protein
MRDTWPRRITRTILILITALTLGWLLGAYTDTVLACVRVRA